tara:strand:+ start:3385 stop:4281 length:897 start_codon:yes stop_codon:yes gene_type:complete
MIIPEKTLFESNLTSLNFLHRGKVRDIYAVDEDKLLIIQTDRLSAFDLILPTPIPGKGKVLTAMSNFWFKKLGHIIPNHLTDIQPESLVSNNEIDQVSGRSFVVKKLKPVPIEAIVRGYIIGSSWKDYKKTNTICGIKIPAGLKKASKLPSGPIFTPSTKAEMGAHDENISFSETEKIIGSALALKIRDKAIALYAEAADYAATNGIIIADTKFEFGQDHAGELYLIDEALTPDSSRFWPTDKYSPGGSPPSYDKQLVRDWLEMHNWNKKAPAPILSNDILTKTSDKYHEILKLLTNI